MISDYSNGGLKDIDIRAKIKSLNLSWIRRLFNENFHPWKNIPLKLINDKYGQEIFYPNLKLTPPERLPIFYKKILENWSEMVQEPLTAECILAQHIWYNSYILINNTIIKKLLNFPLFINDIWENGQIMTWNSFKRKFNLCNQHFFKYRQIVDAIPLSWKTKLRETNPETLPNQPEMHIMQLTRKVPLQNLTSKLLYTILLHSITVKPTAQTKIENKLQGIQIDWTNAYLSGRAATIDTYGRNFHYKCSQNILYLNERLFKFGKSTTSRCSYCDNENESILHLFYSCNNTKSLWNSFQTHLHSLNLPNLTPRSAYLGFDTIKDSLIHQLHLIFRISIYKKRETGTCNVNYIMNKIKSISKIERNLTFYNERSRTLNTQKWQKMHIFL